MRLFIVMLLVFMACISSAETFKKYEDPIHNFTVMYPADWSCVVNRGKDAATAPDMIGFMPPLKAKERTYGALVSVAVMSSGGKPITAKGYQDMMLSTAQKEMKNFTMVEGSKVTIGGAEGAYVIYSGANTYGNWKYKVYTVVIDSCIYVLTYRAQENTFDEFLPKADGILKSLAMTVPKKG